MNFMMKVEGNTRGRKQRVPRGRGRGQRTNFQSTDLVVTVSNEDSSSSRLKPPVTTSQPRKIVLNRKTESTNLEKVTVKSLDEIKREKEQRQLRGSAHETTRHDSLQAGGSAEDSGEDRNLFGTSSKPVEVERSCPSEPVATTPAGSGSALSNSSGVKSRLSLKKLTIPLKALPSVAPHHKVLSEKQPISAAIPSSVKTSEIYFDSDMSDQEFDCLDDDDSALASDLDEDFLLKEETETKKDAGMIRERSENHQGGKDANMNDAGFSAYVDYTDVPLAQDYAEEEEDDVISLHPDDSLLDEEDELSTNSNRLVRPRILGRRSGSESRDLRMMITDRQKQSEESSSTSTTTAVRPSEKSQPDNGEINSQEMEKDAVRGDKSHSREKSEKVSPKLHHRERESHWRGSRRQENERWRDRAPRGRSAQRNGGNAFSRRGKQGLRPGPRRESRSNVQGPPLLGYPPALPPIFTPGDGLLPLPVNVSGLSQVQAALEEKIKSAKTEMQMTVLQMLTNPPPVPGEHVPEYDQYRQQPPKRHGLYGPRESKRTNERHPPKRPQRNVPDANNTRNIGAFMPEHATYKEEHAPNIVQVPLQKKAEPSADLPKWLQRTQKATPDEDNDQQVINEANVNPTHQESTVVKTGGEVSQYETTDNACRQEAVAQGSQKDCNSSTVNEVEKARLARESRSSTDHNSEMQVSTSKRKSPFHGEEIQHGGKIVIETSPEGLPQPGKKFHPKGYCFQQLDTGCCTAKSCKYMHLPYAKLIEYQRSMQSENTTSQGDHFMEAQPEDQLEQTATTVQELQPQEEEVPSVSYQSVTELLSKKNLRAAWQMIEKLSRTNKPDFDILRRTLVVCSEHLEEPDIAAQVACQAFDMIGEGNGPQHRHDYTVLIKTLCHSGQYIRAYEMLDVMKKNNHMPTYEVFLDLVQASAKDPEWAFNLLDEIKQSGLFKSGICSDLILLGCNSGEHFVDRTWFLFQEALQSQVQISAPAFQTMLLTLSQRNYWEKIMSVIAFYPEAVPTEILNTAILTASRKADWVEIMIGLLATAPAQKLTELGPDVWNSFLSSCCVKHASNLLYTQKIYSLMQQNGITLTPQSTNNYMSALSHANNWDAALGLFNAACEDPQVLEHPQVLEKGLIALTMALSKAGAMVDMLTVVHFMLEHQIKPDDSVLQSAVESLDKEKNYKGVHQFFCQLKAAEIVPPVVVYKQIISTLENWTENPTASVEPYIAMRRAYPAKQPDDTTKEEAISSDNNDTNEQQRHQVCKYYGTPRGCFSGNNCKFLHPEGAVSFREGSTHGSGGSTPGGSITGSISEKRPSNPFVLQGQGVQLGDIPSNLCQGDHQINQIGSDALSRLSRTTPANYMPFTEITNPGSFQVPLRAEISTSSEASFKIVQSQSQNQGNICQFYSTPQGCRHGDNCRFVHHQSSVSMSANSNPTLSEVVPGLRNGLVARGQAGNPFVFKDPTFSAGQANGAGLFEPAHDQQHTSTSGINTQAGLHLGGPFSANTRQHPAAQPISGSRSHFQLAVASQFTGANPFSPSVPGRTRSVEDFFREPRAADQNRQAQSAPVVPEMLTVSHFQFPSKKSVQFYLPRIKHASEHQSWEDLGYVYVNMKNEELEIDYDVLQVFYDAFEANCPQTVGECFEKLSLKIHYHLEQRMPNLEPDSSPSALLDDDDKFFLGQLGVALMYLSYSKQLFSQGYTVLHVLHNFSINYSLYSGEFGLQKRALTTSEVALTAADICLNIKEPLYGSALEVLRGTNYALPSAGTMLTPEEAKWRRGVFLTLCQHFTSSQEFDLVFELLGKVGDIEVFGSTDLKVLYNALLCGLIKNNQLDNATEIFQTMVQSRISREPESVRALVNGFGEAGCTQEAKRHFMSGVYSGVYPPIFSQDNPWTVPVGVSFSALESQFYIEKHLISLQEFIAQCSSGDGVLDDNLYRPLTVVIKTDEVPNLYTSNKYVPKDEIIHTMREKICTVLTDNFNPPLSCTRQSKVEELVVSAMSLKCWFRANPATGRFKGGSFSCATSQPTVAKEPPYLQPGMSSVVSSNGLEGEARRVSVFSKMDKVFQGSSFPAGEYQQPSLTRKNHHRQCFVSSSSRNMSGSGHAKFSKFT